MRCEEGSIHNHETVATHTPHGREGGLEGFGAACLHADELDADRARLVLQFASHARMVRAGWVNQYGQSNDPGYRFFQELELLSEELECAQLEPREIAAWPRQTGNYPKLYEVGSDPDDD